MTDPREQKRDRENRAAELALGLLCGADRAEAEREKSKSVEAAKKAQAKADKKASGHTASDMDRSTGA